MELAFSIDDAPTLVVVEAREFLLDTVQTSLGTLAIVVEEFVLRLALAQAHALHIGHEQLHLIVGIDAIEQLIGSRILHLGNAVESQVVESLGPTGIVVASQAQCLLCIDARRIE